MIKNEGKVQAYQVCGQIRLVDALLTSPLLPAPLHVRKGLDTRLAQSYLYEPSLLAPANRYA
jgi:hypothetical protein